MRFASLGSGSRGNATLVEAGATCLLIDCGFSAREATRRLRRLGLDATALAAILVTHEHGDHIAGVGQLARRFGIPVYATPGTIEAGARLLGTLPSVTRISAHEPFTIGDLEVSPMVVPHDAREPCQFVLGDGARRLGVLTDAGSITRHVVERLAGCDGLVLEFNHDAQLLSASAYPPALRARIASDLGHLSNGQAAELLALLDTSRLRQLVPAHLSEANNTPALALAAAARALGCAAAELSAMDQASGLDWRGLD